MFIVNLTNLICLDTGDLTEENYSAISLTPAEDADTLAVVLPIEMTNNTWNDGKSSSSSIRFEADAITETFHCYSSYFSV